MKIMKIDKGFDSFFQSIGMCITSCTLVVAIGKMLTPYYFYYIILFLMILVATLSYIDHQRQTHYKPPVKPTLKKKSKSKEPAPRLKKKIFRTAFKRKHRRTSSLTDLPQIEQIELLQNRLRGQDSWQDTNLQEAGAKDIKL